MLNANEVLSHAHAAMRDEANAILEADNPNFFDSKRRAVK